MIRNKFHYFFVCFVIFTANVFSSIHRYPKEASAFKEFLQKNSNLIATRRQLAIRYQGYGTIAHKCVNQNNLDHLMMLIDAGETAAQPLEPNLNRERKLIGSTAFLGLCFRFKHFDNENSKQALELLNLFAQRTPEVVTMARYDKMTPAMAIACSKSVETFDALKILLQHNPHAFEGTAERDAERYPHAYPRTVPFLLIASAQQNSASKDALNLVLTTLKNHNAHNVKHQFSDLINFAYQIYKHNFANFLERWGNANLQNQLQPGPIFFNSCITPIEGCLCCKYQCFCCQRPKQSNHTNFWLEFYQKNPEHPNAQAWLQQYNELVQQVW